MTATTAADTTGAVTGSSTSRPALDGQVLVQVTIVPLAISRGISFRNSLAFLSLVLMGIDALSKGIALQA